MYGPQGGGGSAPRPIRKVTVPEIRGRKGGAPITMITAYDYTMARLLDEVATIPGMAGVLLTFDEFVSGTEIFGERIQPLMQCRRHVQSPVPSAVSSTVEAAE